jgi:histidine triad (HIT) family protein
MQDSIFTKIIKGEIPSYKIYEDELTYAFLDIHPKTRGHVLVVPKKQVEFAWNLPEEDYIALMQTVKKVALRIKKVLNPPYIGEQIVGMDIPHTHVHVFPFSTLDEYMKVPDMGVDPDHDSLTEVAEKLAF